MRIIVYLLPFIALLVVALVLGWGVQDTEVRSYRITGVGFDEGVVIRGAITLDNPSRLPVPIRGVDYTVSSDGGVITKGSLDGWLLTPGESETNMTITLTSESVLSALRTTRGEIEVSGDVHVLLLPPLPYSDTHEIPGIVARGLEGFQNLLR